MVSEGAKILGSSVVNLAEGADIASTAAAAMRHYKDVQVEKVLIGGSDITSELQAKLQKDLGKPIEALKAAVSGLSAQDIQKYLIPYSLQLSPSLGPEEETTINLLPPKWVRKYLNKKLKLQILSLLLISSLFIWGCLLAAGTVYFYLVGEQKTLAENPAISSADPPQELSKRVEGVNNVAKRTEAILAASKYPQDVLNAIFAARPANVVIETYLIDMETGKVSLSGIAADRRSLVDFKDALEKNKAFSLIQVPVSSFEAETNLEYVVNFIYLPATPKKATPTPQPK